MEGVTLDSVFRHQMLALAVHSVFALVVQGALSRLASVRGASDRAVLFVVFRNRTFQLAGASFCLLNLAVAVFRYHYGSAPVNSGVMAFKMLFNAGVMGALAIAGYWASRRVGSRWHRAAHALLAWAGQSAALVFFDLIFAVLWFGHFIRGV